MKDAMPDTAFAVEIDRANEDLQRFRDQLDSDRKKLADLEDQLKKMKDGADLITLSPDEQAEWATVLLGDSPAQQRAERLVKLQSEWLDRFGASDGFLKPLIERSSIVAATCVGLAAIEETDEVEFDLCIIDEASKATAMESSVPMARSKRWVLVGDSKQLPPFREEVLARPELRERFDIESFETAESMFERFRRLLPEQCQTMLTTQYRMAEPIGRMISECFYDGELESSRKEIDPVLSSFTGRAVNWLSTRKALRKSEHRAGTSFVNAEEASAICDLVLDLEDILADSAKTDVTSVLVLSAYGAQVSHLERRMRNIRQRIQHLKVECCTVDRVQGRESDVVFFSVTRSNASRTAGFLRALSE